MSQDDPNFIPASSFSEATSRIYSMTGGAPGNGSPGKSRGVRRALSVLATSLSIAEDRAWTSATIGERLAEELEVVWSATYVQKSSVTLSGVNALLAGARAAYSRGELKRVTSSGSGLDGPIWSEFVQAPSKIEAVTRIAALTNAPREWLGPGSKEHKSALQNLADNLFPDDPRIDQTSKHRLGASLARVFESPWSEDATATGQTVTLAGLNSLLAGAERHLGRLGATVTDALATPEAEGAALAAALLAALPSHWDGRRAVRWLSTNDLRGSNDLEWQGFYGEERARAVLDSSFSPSVPGPQLRYGATRFDYGLTWPWDIKVHTAFQVLPGMIRRSSSVLLLNDERAVRCCVEQQGLGFLVISGAGQMDHDGSFKAWQDARKLSRIGRASAPSNSGRSRMRKAAFRPTRVDAYWIADSDQLEQAMYDGSLMAGPQGRQAPASEGGSGDARNPKFRMNLIKANRTLRIASHAW